MCCPRRLIVMGVSSDCGRNLIGWRTQSDRVADGIRLGGERKPIGWRTESDRVANGNRWGGGWKPIGWRVPSRGCTCLKCTDKAILILLLFCWCSSCLLGWCTSCSGKRQSRAETSAPPKENAEEQKQYSRWTYGYGLRLHIIIYRWLQGGALEIF